MYASRRVLLEEGGDDSTTRIIQLAPKTTVGCIKYNGLVWEYTGKMQGQDVGRYRAAKRGKLKMEGGWVIELKMSREKQRKKTDHSGLQDIIKRLKTQGWQEKSAQGAHPHQRIGLRKEPL